MGKSRYFLDGAAAGNLACICNVLRIAISYNSFDVLEDGYGINLRPLSMFAARVYQDDPCERFMPRILDENLYDAVDSGLAARMHKAIAVIQFKVEGAMIMRHPEYGMEDRLLLPAVDYEKGTVTIGGRAYPMLDTNFPTIDPRNPLELTRGEKELLRVLSQLEQSCQNAMQNRLDTASGRLMMAEQQLSYDMTRRKLTGGQAELAAVQKELDAAAQSCIQKRQAQLRHAAALADSLSPYRVLGRGYAMVYDSKGRLCSTDALAAGDKLTLRGAAHTAECMVTSVEELNESTQKL